ncbi:MAG: Lrp/AsnC family transcriptional regulator [Kordiimonadaceae bacterium]|jgi:DNA-binding Lrp family transcriptional regulator|nr:Lrp/AsnC family transcriptional regulator [Kordiimonadaceae bacterium]MDB4044153.1 Lrp/AsnC family transcriptional regulator [Emcibacteraceae bacterium]MBT6135529.1 Lrp/AsnC family transcriptional regulator [Kordiimonadaceae bacterium]MBT6467210.1 Lrp/AsnC family transcriptional regulator [Kordiimonadaceae bacterium]MBT7545546.1 Lrp/AsnC family transcriptional regulator [Kordiimonadaceae bacterium]
MQHIKLDEIDLIILQVLQEEGRTTNVRLAERAGITPPPCLRRVKALEDAGLISGYHAELSAKALGYDLVVFAMVGLHSQAESDLQAFESLVNGWPMVREAYMLNGEIDFILKIVARDLNHFQNFLTTHLTPAPNVESVKTSLSIRCGKYRPGIPFTPVLPSLK